jgi:hypothetical protein
LLSQLSTTKKLMKTIAILILSLSSFLFSHGQSRETIKVLKIIPAHTLADANTALIKETDIIYPKNAFVTFVKNGLNEVTQIIFECECLENSSWQLKIDVYEPKISEGKLTDVYLSLRNYDPIRLESIKVDRIFTFSYNWNYSKSDYDNRLICFY